MALALMSPFSAFAPSSPPPVRSPLSPFAKLLVARVEDLEGLDAYLKVEKGDSILPTIELPGAPPPLTVALHHRKSKEFCLRLVEDGADWDAEDAFGVSTRSIVLSDPRFASYVDIM